MTNPSFSQENLFKIGMTKDLEQRKQGYRTSFPGDCSFPYVTPEITLTRKRERAIFKILEKSRCTLRREFFILPLQEIIDCIEKVIRMSSEELNTVLKKNDYESQYTPFLKFILSRTEKSKYDRVYISDLYTNFKVWCKAKLVNKFPTYDGFYEYIGEKYKIKSPNDDDDYLEKIVYKV